MAYTNEASKTGVLTDERQKTMPEVSRGYLFLKRTADIVLSSLALIVLSPLMLVVALLIRRDGGPAIFTQTRVGKNGKFFRMHKFRSMCMGAERMLKDLQDQNESDGLAFKMSDDPRVTRIGKIIRKTSIDELPQLWDILAGHMSIVGPRPPLGNEVYYYNDYQMQRLLVKPGLTCYWQCMGRNDISFDEWMELDMKYIEERGIWTDIKIVLMTIPAVLCHKGVK